MYQKPQPLARKSAMKRAALFMVGCVLAGRAFGLEPPAPGDLERYRSEGTLPALSKMAERYGNHKVKPYLAERTIAKLQGVSGVETAPTAPLPDWQGMPTTGTNKILIFLIDFPDAPHANQYDTITNKLFGAGIASEYPRESLQQYYRRSSYGKLTIQGDVLGWYRMQHPRSWYTNQYGDGNLANAKIVEEVAQYYNPTHDYSQYDNNHDGKIDYFAVLWAGAHGAWSTFWWGYQWELTSMNLTMDGVRFYGFSWQWESYNYPTDAFTATTIIHETGHALGLPDYYDYDGTVGPSGGLGGLDMMDANRADHNAFSKFMLDWLSPVVVTNTLADFPMRATAQYPDAVIAMNTYTGGTPYAEYFMVQNRYRVLNDTNSTANGLLIWHVDARTTADGKDFLYNNSSTSHKLLRLMEADGLEEIEKSKSANAGDYYNRGESFTPYTTPNSMTYGGNSSQVSVTDISADGPTMTADITVRPQSVFAFTNAGYEVSETCGVVVITVARIAGTDLAARVDYATSNGTAHAGSDYTAVAGTLVFSAGMASSTISVAIVNDGVEEPAETLAVVLSNPSSNAFIAGPKVLTLSLLDGGDRTPPSIVSAMPQDSNTVYLVFSEKVSRSGAESVASYSVTPGVAVESAIMGNDARSLALGLATSSGGVYTLTVSNVQDLAGNMIGAGFRTNFVLPGPSPAMWLRFDEMAGTTASDATGHGHAGTLQGEPVWTAGRTGGAIQFDGIDDAVVVPDFAYGPELTVAFWFKVSGNAGSSFQYVLSHGTVQQSHNLNVCIGEDGSSAPGVVRTSFADASDPVDQATLLSLDASLPGFPDSDWHLYTLTVKKGEGARVYIDGVLRVANSSLGGDALDPSGPLALGARSSSPVDHCYQGLLDDVRIYSRSLASNEVAFLFDRVPAVAISAPGRRDFLQGESIDFIGSASDTDGVVTSLVWRSSVDGRIGSGLSFTDAALSPGVHTVTLAAYDQCGARGATSVAVTVHADGQTNGLPDDWESAFWPGGGSGGSTNDSDRDGLSNWEEWLAGSDPTNPLSTLEITAESLAPGTNGIVIRWPCIPDRWYGLCWSTNPAAPASVFVSNLASGASGILSYTDTVHTAESCGFYRLRVSR